MNITPEPRSEIKDFCRLCKREHDYTRSYHSHGLLTPGAHENRYTNRNMRPNDNEDRVYPSPTVVQSTGKLRISFKMSLINWSEALDLAD